MEMFFLLLFDPLLLLLLSWFSVDVCPLWMLCLQLNLFCRVLRAHGGKLQACSAFLMCSISLCSVCWLVQTTLAPCAKVLKTLLFTVIKWLLSQCRYWSVCGLSVDSGDKSVVETWWKPMCPGKVKFHLGLILLWWIIYVGPVSWCVVIVDHLA